MSDPALVLEIDAAGEEALVEMRGQQRRLSVALLTLEGTPVAPGDWVLASAGMAVERMDESDAKELAALIAQARDQEDRP
ncbi:MAG: HypC/HybG/HupF family hydrogenase formation chaperone [Actinomycetota bacterium]